MKKIIFLVIVLLASSQACDKVELIDFDSSIYEKNLIENQSQWKSVEISNQALKKIVIYDNSVFIFSIENCFISSDLVNWQTIELPVSSSFVAYAHNPFPVIFNDNIYIDGANGVYKLMPDLSWQLIFEKSISAIAADEDYLYTFNIYGSFRSSDGINFEALEEINEIIWPVPRQPHLEITFAKADKGKIILSGTGNTAMAHEFVSLDYGITWQAKPLYLVHDFIGNQRVFSDHGNVSFKSDGDLLIQKLGGRLEGVISLNEDYYFSGESNKFFPFSVLQNKGIILKNDDFENAVFTEKKVRKLKIFEKKLIAISDDGKIYFKKL